MDPRVADLQHQNDLGFPLSSSLFASILLGFFTEDATPVERERERISSFSVLASVAPCRAELLSRFARNDFSLDSRVMIGVEFETKDGQGLDLGHCWTRKDFEACNGIEEVTMLIKDKQIQENWRPGFHYVVLSSPYPPGPSSSAHQRSAVYVGVLNKDDLTEWYSFAINGAEKPYEQNRGRTGLDDDGIPVVAPINTKRLSNSSSCAAVDSTIYCIGGTSSDLYASRPYYLKVRRWDTNSVSPGEQSQPWVRSTPMKVARCLAEAVALNGKIYVMGGVNNDEGGPEPWAEVFDPQSSKWVSLDPPSPKPTSSVWNGMLRKKREGKKKGKW
ncbi:hypothetical protein RHGRI_037103 [Rhododendron griersonianum]|uniref:Uncharacterized protein n=1 Tax=Rhododendron griersonianum TaxID=479676 RepID=A0AAV6HR46_9ERIC|nr:hypothetical protein RHGRI_037103 [Rhododendron griersonianum]